MTRFKKNAKAKFSLNQMYNQLAFVIMKNNAQAIPIFNQLIFPGCFVLDRFNAATIDPKSKYALALDIANRLIIGEDLMNEFVKKYREAYGTNLLESERMKVTDVLVKDWYLKRYPPEEYNADKVTNPTDTRKSAKRFEQINKEDGTVLATFSTTADAEQSTGIRASCICNALKGRSKTAGGYIWRYTLSSFS